MSMEQGQGPDEAPQQGTTPDGTGHGDDDHGDGGDDGRRRGRTLAVAAIALVASAAVVVGGAFLVQGALSPGAAEERPGTAAAPTPSRTATPSATATPTPTPAATPTPQAATPEPEAPDVPAPSITPVAAGTVVAEGDVVSPKGSVRYHYRVVANGDDSYSTEYSGFTSSLPVPVSVTLLEIPPVVGDGLTATGPGDLQLGGPTSAPEALSTVIPGTTDPTYLGTLVTYSSTDSTDVPIEIGPMKVLAVATVSWAVPQRQTNVVPVDGGARAGASGAVGETTDSGAPKGYLVAADDTVAAVAERFGISTSALIWLNEGLEVLGDEQRLFIDTVLNLDPESR